MLLGKIILSYALTLEINFYAQIIGGRLIILQFLHICITNLIQMEHL